MSLTSYSLFGTSISFAYIWFAVFAFPALHRILRNKVVYFIFLIFSISTPIIYYFAHEKTFVEKDKEGDFLSFYLLFFLILYKCFDRIILNKYQRHLYFSVRYNRILQDPESDESKSLDNLFQFSLLIIPIILFWFIENYIES